MTRPRRRPLFAVPLLAVPLLAVPLLLALPAAGARAQAPAASPGAAPGAVPNATALDVRDLPLTEVRAAPGGTTLAVFLTGDGGWATLDRGVGAALVARGVSVVAVNSRAYLGGPPKTPDRAAADVARVARAYMARWGATSLVLVGYSRGADLLPFVANRLPADLRERTVMMAMLGLATGANFHFHFGDLFHDVRRPDDRPTAPELQRLKGALPARARLVCVYGADEDDSGCRGAAPFGITVVARPGGHHFDGEAREIGDQLAALLPR